MNPKEEDKSKLLYFLNLMLPETRFPVGDDELTNEAIASFMPIEYFGHVWLTLREIAVSADIMDQKDLRKVLSIEAKTFELQGKEAKQTCLHTAAEGYAKFLESYKKIFLEIQTP